MPNELRPLVRLLGLQPAGRVGGFPVHRGAGVVVVQCGIGRERAAEATRQLLARDAVRHVLLSGIAGGLDGEADVGQLVVPAEVVDRDDRARYAATPPPGVALTGVLVTGGEESYRLDDAGLAALRTDGVVALDMETSAVAAVCASEGIPWTALRAVSDLAGDKTVGPVVMTLVRPDGRPRTARALRYLLAHPQRVPRLIRLGREADAAARTAAEATTAAYRALS